MNKTILTVAALACLLLAATFAYKSCRLYDDLSIVKGAYEEARRQAADDAKVAERAIQDANASIALQSEKISVLEGKIAASHAQIADKDKDLAALQIAYKDKNLTDTEKIANLEAQVRVWSDKFSVAGQIIQNQHAEILAWESKFNSQVKISDAWKLKYENEARLHGLCREQLGILEGRVKWLGFKSKLVSAVAVGVGGYLIYDAIKK